MHEVPNDTAEGTKALDEGERSMKNVSPFRRSLQTDGVWIIDPADTYVSGEITPERVTAAAGYIPTFVTTEDQRPAKEQLTERYGFGPLFETKGFLLIPKGNTFALRYVGESGGTEPLDPDLFPLLSLHLPFTDEEVIIYPHAWVAILSLDESLRPKEYFITRMD